MWSTVKTYLTHEKFNINDFEAVIEDNPFTKSKTELFLAVDQIHDFALWDATTLRKSTKVN